MRSRCGAFLGGPGGPSHGLLRTKTETRGAEPAGHHPQIEEKTMPDNIHGKLYHKTPAWVDKGAVFHVRIRVNDSKATPLTQESVAKALLASVRFYEETRRWYTHLFLLMPDHLHALLVFDLRADSMAHVIGDWKGFHKRQNKVQWQENFFDHRIRNRDEFEEKAFYIRMNPVRQGLCQSAEDWRFVLDRMQIEEGVESFMGGPRVPSAACLEEEKGKPAVRSPRATGESQVT